MDSNDTELKIVLTMIEYGEPLICQHIAKKSELDQQLVAYHLKNMLEKGILLKEEADNRKYYLLQPIFYDENVMISLFSLLTPVVEQLPKEMEFDKCLAHPIRATTETLKMLLVIFQSKLTKIF